MAACQEVEGEGGSSGSSLLSRLRSLGDRVAERLKGTLRLGIQKALSVVSMHYVVDFEHLAMGYIIAMMTPRSMPWGGLMRVPKAPPPPWLVSSRATSFPTPQATRRRTGMTRRELVRR